MVKTKAAMAAVLVMAKEGVSQAFGVPGAAINPLSAALRVTDPAQIEAAPVRAQAMAHDLRVPVVVECTLETVTDIAMGTEIDKVGEFEEIVCRHPVGREGLVTAGLLE